MQNKQKWVFETRDITFVKTQKELNYLLRDCKYLDIQVLLMNNMIPTDVMEKIIKKTPEDIIIVVYTPRNTNWGVK